MSSVPHPHRLSDRQLGAMLGLAVGDALGAPVEFCLRDDFDAVTDMCSGGYFDLPAGAWTDDTAMSLALYFSLKKYHGLNAEHLLGEFYEWMANGKYSSTGKSVGIGQNTFWVLSEFGRNRTLRAERHNTKADGNGSLMRLAPVAVLFSDDKEMAINIASEQSRTTHASDIAAQACEFSCHILVDLINGAPWEKAIAEAPDLTELTIITSGYWQTKSREQISSSGYVLDTLEATLWCVEHSQSFDEAVLLAANLGDDADTVAAVTGQFAGARYGLSAINPSWVEAVRSHGYPSLERDA